MSYRHVSQQFWKERRSHLFMREFSNGFKFPTVVNGIRSVSALSNLFDGTLFRFTLIRHQFLEPYSSKSTEAESPASLPTLFLFHNTLTSGDPGDIVCMLCIAWVEFCPQSRVSYEVRCRGHCSWQTIQYGLLRSQTLLSRLYISLSCLCRNIVQILATLRWCLSEKSRVLSAYWTRQKWQK